MDDTLFLITAAVVLIASIIALKLFAGSKSGKNEDEAQPAVQEARPRPQQRALAERGNRVRMRMNAGRRQQADAQGSEEELSGSDVDVGPRVEIPEGMKVGKKKMAKLEAKAEKKSMREAEEREREERKEREAKEEETKRKQEEMEKKLEEENEEAERKEREEREKREHEEYLKMKAAFSVEEEGCEGTEEADERNLLQDFISYIKNVKVVPLDDLAAHFKLKTVDAINRVEHLVSEGSITGVMDDRGKFIYIGQEELESVAKFIRQRGRVSLTELVQESNKLINLEPDITALESIAEVK